MGSDNDDYDDDNDVSFHVHSDSDDDFVTLPLKRVISTHKYCILCNSKSNIKTIPMEARYQVFIKRRIIIPKGDRCCSNHLIRNKFFEDELLRLRIHSNTSVISAKETSIFLNLLSVKVDETLFNQISNFTMPEEQLIIFTGLNWENIISLTILLTSLKYSVSRSVTQALVVFLMKLKTGISNKVLSSILQLEREQQVSDFVQQIIQSFEKDILPIYFGIG